MFLLEAKRISIVIIGALINALALNFSILVLMCMRVVLLVWLNYLQHSSRHILISHLLRWGFGLSF